MEYCIIPNNNPTSKGSSSSSSSFSSSNNENKDKEMKKKGVVRLSTDPQSVAARERRHRISDRFKILQSMVPGGSKMDTVSMLEEAIHYVKFLKAQVLLHQTLLINNFVDINEHVMLQPQEYYFPDDDDENIISLIQQQNASVSSVDSLLHTTTLPQLPIMDEHCCFKGEEDATNTNFDSNMKYYWSP
ncbi:hypothetical protein RIF29_26794 [Crotalaria pallida]|uniref:BHLH domain-containing protein n=1 Tax=Crotalaria pallida TaxID=3830 RepID=A0AAN9I005_CROPI